MLCIMSSISFTEPLPEAVRTVPVPAVPVASALT
jgi:hypothetical protein